MSAVPYDSMAPHYHAFTAHHDYDRWTGELEAAARRHGLSGDRLLDVACGTGKSFAPFLARGWRVTGCDASEAMLRVAQDRSHGRATLVCRDMRALGELGEFDLIACLGDGVNHLLDEADLVAAFASARANAAPGALYLFDVNCLATYRGFFATTLVAEEPERLMVWQGLACDEARPGARAVARFTAFTRDGDRWARADAVHEQRHHPRELVTRALLRAGWNRPAVYGQGLDGVLADAVDELRHTKAVYIARCA
jgi:SAM-dependent methyltransferase